MTYDDRDQEIERLRMQVNLKFQAIKQLEEKLIIAERGNKMLGEQNIRLIAEKAALEKQNDQLLRRVFMHENVPSMS